MAISLKKGQGVSLKKSEYDLSMVTIGLGWDINEEKKGLLGSLFGKKEEEYDLDVVAFLCDANGKVQDLGGVDGNNRVNLVGGDIVFFNSMRHSSGCIWLTGDNRTGAGDGDDEQIIVKLNDLPEAYQKIVFVVQIYGGQKRGKTSVRSKTHSSALSITKTRKWLALTFLGGLHFPSIARCCLRSWSVSLGAGSSMQLVPRTNLTASLPGSSSIATK